MPNITETQEGLFIDQPLTETTLATRLAITHENGNITLTMQGDDSITLSATEFRIIAERVLR